ncbi:hypothetical protein F5Y08DRAFT_355731 [Xylaria arbuscula]|nr:hypothetical protein F5Y08DRAFT_355731 [Xylaria arbuscula]
MNSAGLSSGQKAPTAVAKATHKRKARDSKDEDEGSHKKPRTAEKSKALPQAKQDRAPGAEVLLPVPLAKAAGETPAYSNFRAAICDSQQFFRSHDSGVTSKKCIGTGILLTGKITARDVIKSQVIVTPIGGGFEKDKKGNLFRDKDQSTETRNYKYMLNAWMKGQPIGVVIGKKKLDSETDLYANNLLSIELEHHYNVLDWFFVTEIWPEFEPTQKNGASFKHFMMKLQKIDLNSPSWWVPKGHEGENMCAIGQFHCRVFTCTSCNKESKEIFQQGWCCINASCPKFFHFSTPEVNFDSLQYNDTFLNERVSRDQTVEVQPLIPSLPFMEPTLYGSEKKFKDGIVCPTCRCASRRQSWNGWTCENCGFQLSLPPQDVDMAKIHRETQKALGKRRKQNFVDGRIVKHQQTIPGYDVTIFYLPNSPMNHGEEDFVGSVALFRPAQTALEREGGFDDLFQEMQEATRTGAVQLNRRPARCSGSHKEELTSHFACNMGADYKFGVVVKTSESFSSAPPPVMRALGRLTWTGKTAVELSSAYALAHGLSVDSVSMPTNFVDFNEQLILGYFENSKISFHDDGEKELGPTVATLSLGSPSIMNFRGKEKAGFGTEKKPEPTMLTLRLQHGDTVVMHGTRIHQYFEHSVDAAGIRRYGVTCRYIRPEMMTSNESRQRAIENGKVPLHWQARAYSGETA